MAEKTTIESFDTFEFVGRISCEEKNFKTISADKWEINAVTMKVNADGSVFYVESTGFRPLDETKPVYYRTKDRETKNIQFRDRAKVDTEELSGTHNCISINGDKKRYITPVDFIADIKKIVEANAFNDKKFRISGNVKYQSYIKDGERREVTKYEVNSIVQVDEQEEKARIYLNLYLGDDCFTMEEDEDEEQYGLLRGKSVVRCPEKNTVDNKGYEGYNVNVKVPLGNNPDAAYSLMKKRYYGSDETLHKIGLVCKLVNGSEEVEFTEDMLSDDERDLIMLEMNTFEEIKAMKGVGRGKFRREIVRIREKKGYTESVETPLSLDMLTPPLDTRVLKNNSKENVEEVKEAKEATENDLDDFDIFDL